MATPSTGTSSAKTASGSARDKETTRNGDAWRKSTATKKVNFTPEALEKGNRTTARWRGQQEGPRGHARTKGPKDTSTDGTNSTASRSNNTNSNRRSPTGSPTQQRKESSSNSRRRASSPAHAPPATRSTTRTWPADSWSSKVNKIEEKSQQQRRPGLQHLQGSVILSSTHRPCSLRHLQMVHNARENFRAS